MSGEPTPARVFVDSNLLIEGLVAPWSNSRAILILARTRLFRLVLSPYVEQEVERTLLRLLAQDPQEGSRIIDDYAIALRLLALERTAEVTGEEIRSHRHLIGHEHDVPVLVRAIKAKPDWLVTSNIEHFSQEVAIRTGLRIVTPGEFLRLSGLRSVP